MSHLVPLLRREDLPLMSHALQQARSGLESAATVHQGPTAARGSAPSHAPGPAAAPTPLGQGRYRVVRELARGGMGVVYVARDTELERDVALKQLLDDAVTPAEVDRFRREAKAAARLQHPNVVQVFDVGQEAGAWFMVMDLIRGETLQARLERTGPLPSREVAEVGRALAGALAYAHEQEILHRDVKPHNVLVDGHGTPKLTDFGLAKVADLRERADAGERSAPAVTPTALAGGASLTVGGQLLGTPAFMAPEQANGEPVDARADVYALGATLYALLTGRPPFEAPTLVGLLRRVLEEEPAPPSERADGVVDPRLEAVVLRCLAKRPGDRFPDAEAVARALDDALAGAAGTAPASDAAPPPAGRSLPPPALVVGALGAALALVAVLALTFGGDEPEAADPIASSPTPTEAPTSSEPDTASSAPDTAPTPEATPSEPDTAPSEPDTASSEPDTAPTPDTAPSEPDTPGRLLPGRRPPRLDRGPGRPRRAARRRGPGGERAAVRPPPLAPGRLARRRPPRRPRPVRRRGLRPRDALIRAAPRGAGRPRSLPRLRRGRGRRPRADGPGREPRAWWAVRPDGSAELTLDRGGRLASFSLPTVSERAWKPDRAGLTARAAGLPFAVAWGAATLPLQPVFLGVLGPWLFFGRGLPIADP